MRRAPLAVLVLVVGVPAAAEAGSALRDLPLRGTTERGQQWRLRAAQPASGDDAPASWCLALGYTTGIVVDGDKYTGGLRTCGRRPARRISGMLVVDCERGSVFVFGAVRRGVTDVRLRNPRGLRRRPMFAALPPRSGFSGRTFIAVIDTRQLPARLAASGAGENPVVRVPRRREVCRPHPGAPNGGEPFLDFESDR